MAIDRASTTNGGEPDWISASRATGAQLRQLKATGEGLYPRSRARIQLCRDALAGTIEAPIPTNIAKDIAKGIRVRHATSITTPLNLANVLARKRPKIKRYSVAYGRDPDDVASEIEDYANAALELAPPYGFPWADCVEILLNEGECGLIVAPRLAHWERLGGDRTTTDGKVVDFESFKGSRRRSSNDRKSNARAFAAEEEAFLARRFPVHIRAISPLNCYPFFGSGGNLVGLLTWSMYSAVELVRAGYIWENMRRHLTPSGGASGLGLVGEVEVLEWWSTDINGDPYVAMSVEGSKTANLHRSEDADGRVAVINLRKECGITRMPVTYEFGQHFSTTDLDQRSVPFTWPYVQGWLAADALATATVYAGWRNGFLSFALKRSPSANPGVGLEMSQPKTIDVAPNKIIDIGENELIPLRHEGVGPDVTGMIQHLLGHNEENGPPASAFGGEAPSMADRSLSRKYVEDAQSHTVEASRRMYEFAGEEVLEICWAIGKKYRPVPLAVNTLVPPKQTGRSPSPTRAIITLDPESLGSPAVFDVVAEWTHVPGENLATAQQFAGFVEQGLLLVDEFRELAMGDSSPQMFSAKKFVQDFYNSDEGRADLMEYTAQKLADRKLAARFKMQQEGMLTPQGIPPGMLAGIQAQPGVMAGMGMTVPPQGGGAPVAGTAMPNLAASQLGGIVGGQIAGGSRIAEAAGGAGAMGPSAGPGG